MASAELVKFPDDFYLGTGSSAYQIEGAWKQDGKSASIWDYFFHSQETMLPNPKLTQCASPRKAHNSFQRGTDVLEKDPTRGFYRVNGDIACDSYNKLDEDIRNLVDLKVNIYRFSISWPRVLPYGDDRCPNEVGINYYKELIKKLKDNKITPMITMYHWDLPNVLQEIGGWSNPNIVQYFKIYAKFLFETFGSDVKLWSTINEPRFVAMAYGNKTMAPCVSPVFNGVGDYMVVRNVLLAHSVVYRMYKKTFFEQQQGEISLCLDTAAYYPENPDLEEDREAVTRSFDSSIAIFTQPMMTGEFPKSVLDAIAETNKYNDLSLKRIFEFSDEEKKVIKGAYDFIAFNYYDSYKVRKMFIDEYATEKCLVNQDLGVITTSNAENMEDTFSGFTQVIDWFVKNCDNPKLFIAENGIYEETGTDDSNKKIKYHRGILTELDKALKKGVVIKGYCVWSFMDSLEWAFGYFQKLFGIISVDFNDPGRPRSKKQSYEFFQKLFETKTLQPNESD